MTTLLVARDDFVQWELDQDGKRYRNDEHRCDPNSETHDCSGLPCASMRANGVPSYPCLDTSQVAARIIASGKRCSYEVARATKGYVFVRLPTATKSGHMATSLGDGRTIEAYDTADGVIIGHSDGRHWDVCGPFDGVDYTTPAGPNPGPRTPGEARDMGMTAAKIVPGAHAQTKAPWEGRFPFVGFQKNADLTTDAVGFNGARITNPPNEHNPHGATNGFGVSVYHLGVLHADIEAADIIAGAIVGLAGDGGTAAIHATPHYL